VNRTVENLNGHDNQAVPTLKPADPPCPDPVWCSDLTSGVRRLLLTAREAAAYLAISERTLWSLTAPRGPIRVVRIGRTVRYDRRDLLVFVDTRKAGDA
jgi:excisionase family DNA binding protein